MLVAVRAAAPPPGHRVPDFLPSASRIPLIKAKKDDQAKVDDCMLCDGIVV